MIDKDYLKMAIDYSINSKCLRRKVGAILVCANDAFFCATNTSNKDVDICTKYGCLRDKNNIKSGTEQEKCRCVHAEIDLIIQCALNKETTNEATLYCTHSPCRICADALIRAKIKMLIYHQKYSDDEPINLLIDAGINIKQM